MKFVFDKKSVTLIVGIVLSFLGLVCELFGHSHFCLKCTGLAKDKTNTYYGLWFCDGSTCKSYTNNDENREWVNSVAKLCLLVSNALSIATVVIFVMVLLKYLDKHLSKIFSALTIVHVLVLMAFVIFATSWVTHFSFLFYSECTIDMGIIVPMIACVFILGTVVCAIMVHYMHSDSYEMHEQEDEVKDLCLEEHGERLSQ